MVYKGDKREMKYRFKIDIFGFKQGKTYELGELEAKLLKDYIVSLQTDEEFEKLGYKYGHEQDYICYEKKEITITGEWTTRIEFWLDSKQYCFSTSCNLEREGSELVDINLHNAIHHKLKELGWI